MIHTATALAALVLAFPALAQSSSSAPGFGADPILPKPDTAHRVQNFSKVVGWPKDGAPKAPEGLKVQRFADGLDSPRSVHVLPNGDVLVAEATTTVRPKGLSAKTPGQMRSGSAAVFSPDRVTLLRDTNGDGAADERHVLLEDLSQPFGLAFVDGTLFVANTDGLMSYPYTLGQIKIEGKGRKLLDLPAGGYNNHWTRNLLVSRDRTKLYVSVGSASNVGEYGLDTEKGRAAIHEIGLDGSNHRIFATGLRNPVGMSLEPTTGALWTAVNERDNLGDDLAPDYITSVKDGGFYGWPFSYWGKNEDPRLKGQGKALVDTAIQPDYAVGSHTASLGLLFYTGEALPDTYRGGAFVAQRGSWNRQPFSGYKVLFVPFKDGKPSGAPQDFLTGFMGDPAKGEAFGRPVGVFQDGRGALLVTDDAGDTIWRVSAANQG
jgi:glucose/arabinose dehydrogenase